MSVEILTVSLSEESIEELARRITNHLTNLASLPVTQSNPPSSQPPQDAEQPAYQTQADPWETATPTPPVQTGQPQYQQQRRAPAAPGTLPSGTPPACPHGVMQPIPAGVNQAGKPYGPGWGCPAKDRNCKAVWSR